MTRGRLGGLVGGLAFIVPGLVAILALTGLFLKEHPTRGIAGAAAGAGAAVGSVAVSAAWGLAAASWRRAGVVRVRWAVAALLGAVGAVVAGPYLVFVLLGCGLIEVAIARARPLGAAGAMVHGVDRHCWPAPVGGERWRGRPSRWARCRTAVGSRSCR